MFEKLLNCLREVVDGAEQKMNELNKVKEENESLKAQIENHVCEKCDHEELISKLTSENESLKAQIENHVCEKCNHEEVIAVLEKELQNKEEAHQAQMKALQAEVDELKKLLVTN